MPNAAVSAIAQSPSASNGHLDIKTLEAWLWDAACSIRGALDAPKFKDYILPLIFAKRLSDVFDDEIARLTKEFEDEKTARTMVKKDHSLVRFYIPPKGAWAEIRKSAAAVGERVTDAMRGIARENPSLQGVIDIVDFNATVIGDTLRNPKLIETRDSRRSTLRRFDLVTANPMWNQDGYAADFYENDPFERFTSYPPASSADWGWAQHVAASLNDSGRAAIVLDTGAVSRGSGNAGTNKEKDARRALAQKDWIEGVVLLPENLFYNTTAPGIILFLNKAKPATRRGQIMLINASQEFEKGRPKNFIPDAGIRKIAEIFHSWKPVEKFARVIALEEAEKNDYNLSPSRYVDTGEAEQHRDVQSIIDDLATLEADAAALNAELNGILKSLGYQTYNQS